MEVEPVSLAEPDSEEADSLVSSNDPDDLANEQTWPTEEEMSGMPNAPQPSLPDAPQGTTPKIIKRVPKGTSEYQAAWIVDEDGDDGDEDENDKQESEDEMEPLEKEEEMQDVTIDDHEMVSESRKEVNFQDLDLEEEEKQ